MQRRHELAVLAALLIVATAAFAQDDYGPAVPAPARGTTGSACYEDCMWHYRNFDNMVDGKAAAYCARPGCGPMKPQTENGDCKQKCADDYNRCMASSPDPQNDSTCPVNNMSCQQTCFH